MKNIPLDNVNIEKSPLSMHSRPCLLLVKGGGSLQNILGGYSTLIFMCLCGVAITTKSTYRVHHACKQKLLVSWHKMNTRYNYNYGGF